MSAAAVGAGSLEEALRLLVDPCTGILKRLRQLPVGASHPRFFHAVAEAADTGAFAPQRNFVFSGGAATTPEGALAKAAGEAVERYCAALFVREEMPFCAARDAPFEVVPPDDFAVHTPEQFAGPGFDLAPFDDTTAIHWSEAVDPLTGARAHVPAAAVHLPWTFLQDRDEAAILQPVSTGLACHGTAEAALTGALCEVVERDAFTLVWQAGLAPPAIEVDSLDPSSADRLARMEAAGYAVELYSIGNDLGIAAVMALARHEAPAGPGIVCSASASPDPAEAARRALEELPHTAHYVMSLKAQHPGRPGTLAADMVMEQDDHLLFWADADRARDLAFLATNPARVALADLPDHRAATAEATFLGLCRAIGRAGHRVWVRDLTTEDVALAGLRVVRAIVPGLHPLVFGHVRRALGGRLPHVRRTLGWPASLRPGAPDNPLPHPFP